MFFTYCYHLENGLRLLNGDSTAFEVLRREKHEALFKYFNINRFHLGKRKSKSYRAKDYIDNITSETLGSEIRKVPIPNRKLGDNLRAAMHKYSEPPKLKRINRKITHL